MSHIPPELNDYIIDFLHDDRRSLRACSLVCRDWRAAARYHIFRKVELPSYKACKTFHNILERSPHLGEFTRDVWISNPYHPDWEVDHARRECDALWATISSRLIVVDSLELSFMTVDAAFQVNLLKNFNLITTLSVQYCRFPSFPDFIATFTSFPSLQSCTLRGVSWGDAGSHTASDMSIRAQDCYPRIKHLVLGRDLDLDSILQWLLLGDICRDIISFTASCTSQADVVTLGELLASTPTLEHLELDWYSSSYNTIDLPFGFSAASCSALRSLALRCPIASGSSVPWVSDFLSQINAPRLEIISLQIRLLGLLDGLDWQAVDKTLSQDTFATVKSIGMKVAVWHTAEPKDNIESHIRNRLPTLNAKGLLAFLPCHAK